MRVLVIEDDPEVARQVVATLKQAGYAVDHADTGDEGAFLGATEPFDAVILDLGLPGEDGLTILQRWREQGQTMPVLILTSRSSWREKVTGLRAGADDYLAKPFELDELLARIEALIRRAAGHASPLLTCGPLQLDTSSHRLMLNGVLIELTALEFSTLAYLMHHPTKVISKTELTEHIYAQDFDRDSNVIEVLINRLRKKLGADFIQTRRGQGYQLRCDDG